MQTCCRGCAVGEAHDQWCQAAPQSDEEFARRLLALDMARLRSFRARRRRVVVRFRDAAACLWDPVWGQLELHDIDEGTEEDFIRRKRRQITISFCYVLCPTLVVGFSCCLRRWLTEVRSGVSPADARRGWTRYFCSISFLLAFPQLAYVLVPYVVDDGYTNYKRHDVYGAKNVAKVVYEDEWWRLVTPIFLHTGWFHLLNNLCIQLRAAITLEYLWGHHIWLVIYFGSGAYGNLASCAYFPDSISVGASGALCGLIGAWPVYLLMTWDQVDAKDREKRDIVMCVLVLAILALIGTSFVMPLVDHAAHAGGMLMGAFLAMVAFAPLTTSRRMGVMMGVLGVFLAMLACAFTAWWVLEVVEPHPSLMNIP